MVSLVARISQVVQSFNKVTVDHSISDLGKQMSPDRRPAHLFTLAVEVDYFC